MGGVTGRRVAVLFHEPETLGAGLSVLRVTSRLRERGWSLAGWFPGAGPLVTEAHGLLEPVGVEWKPVAFSLRGWRREPGALERVRRTPAYLSAVKQWLECERPDVVHANSLLMVPEATVARRLGIPVLTQVHEMPRPGGKRGLTIRWAATVSCLLVAVSEAVAEMLRPPAGETPVRVVRNGIAFASAARASNDGIVGTVGYISRTKGTDVFLRAAALALAHRPNLRFEHVGDHRLWSDDEYDDEVERIASAPALRARVSLLGRANASEALARWETFVLASRREGFPLSSLEAMAAGLPVIATNVGGVPEQIDHLETGVLVRPDDPEALADWIVRLHDNPALRARLGTNARNVVRDRFSLDAQADGLASAYQEVVGRGGRGRRR